jgi:DNA-binding LacI/PurR family transcriptional regulator
MLPRGGGSVCGFDPSTGSGFENKLTTLSYLTPKLVTTRLSGAQIGEQAVETLLQRIKKPDMPQITCMLKPELLIQEA